MYHVFCTIYFLFQIGKFVRTPCIKFIAETSSFFVFLAMIMGASFTERQHLCQAKLNSYRELVRHWIHYAPNLTNTVYANTQKLCIRNCTPEPMHLALALWITGEWK